MIVQSKRKLKLDKSRAISSLYAAFYRGLLAFTLKCVCKKFNPCSSSILFSLQNPTTA
jgi:hypothetical protein